MLEVPPLYLVCDGQGGVGTRHAASAPPLEEGPAQRGRLALRFDLLGCTGAKRAEGPPSPSASATLVHGALY